MNDEQFDVEALNFPEPTTEPTGNETAPVETPKEPEIEEVKEETPAPTETPKDITISDPPAKFDGETDIQYGLRKQIYDAGQAKAQAETDDEKSALAKHIKGLRKELAINSKSSESITPEATKIEASESPTPDQSEEELAKQALNKMGYLSKDEVKLLIEEITASQSKQSEHTSATQEFYSTHKDIASNPAQRDVLEKFVVERFNITPQSTKQDLLVAMDMARTYLFPKAADTRSAKAAESAAKRDLVSVSSNTQSVSTTSKHDEKAAKVLSELGSSMKEMGWEE